MDNIALEQRILKGEDFHTEFKEILPDNEDLSRLIVCFANADGGLLIIGVSDSGKITGISNLDEAIRRIDDVAFNRCEPPVSIYVETVEDEGKTALIVRIPKGLQRPYRTKSGLYYIRASNRCRHASWEEVRRLYQTSESIFFDEAHVARAGLLDIDMDYFKEFIEKYMGTAGYDTLMPNYLKNLRVTTDDQHPTLAGVLFFGKKPQEFVTYAKITAAYIPGNDLAIPPADKKDLTGKIPDLLSDMLKFFRLYLKERHEIKGFEPEVHHEIPEQVLREGLVNAVAHRDYTVAAPIRVFIFENRIEIRTPGKLPNTVTVESMKLGSHVLRNPTIYNFLNKIGMVTDIGSGIPRIIKVMKEKFNRDVDLLAADNEFIVTIPRA
jgi:ATP-dependent DNA helicase RecG